MTGIAIKEIEGVVKTLFLAGFHGGSADIPDALPVLQARQCTPVEVEWPIDKIHGLLPSLVHFRPGKQGSALRSDEERLPCIDLGSLPAQVVTTPAASNFDTNSALSVGCDPFPLFDKSTLGLPLPLSSLLALGRLFAIRLHVVKHQGNLGLVRTALEGLHKQIKLPQSELTPGGRLGGQVILILHDSALVSALIPGAPGLDLNESDALLLLFRISANMFRKFSNHCL